MDGHMLSVGSRVQIISYGPFRGLRGTIRTIHCLPSLDVPFCFYQVELEGTHVKEAIWFAYEEVELISPQEHLTSQVENLKRTF